MTDRILFVGGCADGERRREIGKRIVRIYKQSPILSVSHEARFKAPCDFIHDDYELLKYNFYGSPVEVMAVRGMTHAEAFKLLTEHYHPPKTDASFRR